MDYLDKLIALRVDNDLSQKTVAGIINKSQQGYDHIEKRRAKLWGVSNRDLIALN